MPVARNSRAATAPAGRGRNIRGRAHDPEKCGTGFRIRSCASEKLMRVVGGRLRSRPIAGPKSDALRPTADRLRESLFNILIHAYGDPVTGARVLDLFAGTGALGIEAISRGAAYALFVDDGVRGARAAARQYRDAGPRRRHPHFPPRRHQARAGASARAVHARLPRSALRQGPGREGAGLGARRRLAGAGGADRGGGSGGCRRSRRRRDTSELERREYDDTELVFLRSV